MKVLLIDDDLDIGELVRRSLPSYEVSHAVTLADAHGEIGSKAFDLVLIDIQMPDGNGLDFCAALSNNPEFNNLPKLMLTASDDTSTIVAGLDCGADDYIKKPFSLHELKARVDLHIRKSRRWREPEKI